MKLQDDRNNCNTPEAKKSFSSKSASERYHA